MNFGIINDDRNKFLKPPVLMIPEFTVTNPVSILTDAFFKSTV
jgi:hypothetical protein